MLLASGIQTVDWVVVGLYFLCTIGMGVYFSLRQRSTAEYFLGSRSMPSWVVGLSMIATLLSTISYLAVPGEMIKHGPGWFLSLLNLPLSYVVVAYLFIPFFMRLPITSAYEYLEVRFGTEARTLGALFFVAIRIVWMSVVVYTASLAMAKMTELPLVAVILGVGTFTTFYAAFGGIRAVIWTDVIQFIILCGGAVFAVVYISADIGVAEWVSIAFEPIPDHETIVWSWDPRERLTVVGIVLFAFAWHVCTYSSDQVVIQRYLTTRDGKSARSSFIVCCIGDVLLMLILGAVGFALFAFYQHHAHLMTGELTGNLRDHADLVFPHFIVHQLPAGLTGLIIAALFAAAMSSLDSGVNSVSAVITVDFYERFGKKPAAGKDSLTMAKTLGLILGFTATLMALGVDRIEGNIVEVTNKSTSCVVGPLFGVFALGMFSRSANQVGAIAGAILGFVVGLFVTFAGQWFGDAYNISFMWIIPSSVVVTVVVGLLGSALGPPPSEGQLRFLRRAVMTGEAPVFPAANARAGGGFPVEPEEPPGDDRA